MVYDEDEWSGTHGSTIEEIQNSSSAYSINYDNDWTPASSATVATDGEGDDWGATTAFDGNEVVQKRREKHWNRMARANQPKEPPKFPVLKIEDLLPGKFKEKEKILPKSQTFKRPVRKQFTSLHTIMVARMRDFSRN